MGRTTFTGPVTGGFETYVFTLDDLAASETNVLRFKCPAAGKVLETNFVADVKTGTSNYTLGSTAGDIIANRATPAADTHETLTPTSSPALANRVFAKGDILTYTLNVDAVSTLEGVTFSVTVRYTGHVVASADDD